MENNVITMENLIVRDDEIHVRQMSADICGIFEDALAEDDIYIPDCEREGDEDEACLYGDTYTELEDNVTELLATIKPDFGSTQVKKVAYEICAAFAEVLGVHKIYLDDADVILPEGGVVMTTAKAILAEKVEASVGEFLSIVKKYPSASFNTFEY